MNLYILKPIKEWTPWYDKTNGVIVRAETEESARKSASTRYGNEGREVWLMPDKTSCKVLTADGKREVIMVDFSAT